MCCCCADLLLPADTVLAAHITGSWTPSPNRALQIFASFHPCNSLCACSNVAWQVSDTFCQICIFRVFQILQTVTKFSSIVCGRFCIKWKTISAIALLFCVATVTSFWSWLTRQTFLALPAWDSQTTHVSHPRSFFCTTHT